MAALAIQC
jgi:dimethylsulfone monooxygenase